jgi:hypothetical protein
MSSDRKRSLPLDPRPLYQRPGVWIVALALFAVWAMTLPMALRAIVLMGREATK